MLQIYLKPPMISLWKKTNTLIIKSYSTDSKHTRKDSNELEELTDVFDYPDQQVKFPDFQIELDYFGIELPPGAYELVEIKALIKQKFVVLIYKVDDINKTVKPKFTF